MNKKGTDKMLSMYWFVILTIIAGGIFAMVYVFYGSPYDIREIESNILANKLADCISSKGTIHSSFFDEDGFNEKINETFMDECNINFNVEEQYGKEIQYLYIVDFYKVQDLVDLEFANKFRPEFYFYGGNLNFYTGDINSLDYMGSVCVFDKEGDKDYKRLIECKERRFYSVSEDGEQYLIKIVATIGKSEQNVKQ